MRILSPDIANINFPLFNVSHDNQLSKSARRRMCSIRRLEAKDQGGNGSLENLLYWCFRSFHFLKVESVGAVSVGGHSITTCVITGS